MPEPDSKVVRVRFEAELADGSRCLMDLDADGCEKVVAIGWGRMTSGRHIWEELYRAKAADPATSAEDRAGFLARADQYAAGLIPLPEPKPYNCDRFWEWIKTIPHSRWGMLRFLRDPRQ